MWLNGGQKVTKWKILFFPGTITEVIAFCPMNIKLFIFRFSSPVFLHLPDPNSGSYYCPVLNHRHHLGPWSKLISISLPSNTDLLYSFANLSWCNLLIFYNFSLLHSINWNRTKHIPLCKDAQTLCLFGCRVLFCSSIKAPLIQNVHANTIFCLWNSLT